LYALAYSELSSVRVLPVCFSNLLSSYLNASVCSIMKVHTVARCKYYPGTEKEVIRLLVPDNKVDWKVDWYDYNPPVYNKQYLKKCDWLDPDIRKKGFQPEWNRLDGYVNRGSHMGMYEVVDGFPRNPMGRTGLAGRGCLGRWGPNHAADPIVTRWKRDRSDTMVTDPSSNLPILQFVAILRSDNHEWAIPGGMVDPGEKISATLIREFSEEALNSLTLSTEEISVLKNSIAPFFRQGVEIYKGYVDDPRNTDNAWMETVAYNYHDNTGESVGQFPLNAGDDAVGVRWMDLHSGLKLYASHAELLAEVAKLRSAHW